jgi:hypothetical protein
LNNPFIILAYNKHKKEGEAMKKFGLLISFVVLFTLLSGIGLAQSFSIGVGGGLSQVVGPDYYTKDVSKGGLGFSTEWNAGLTAKLGLPLLPIKPRAIFMYHSFSGSGELDPTLFNPNKYKLTQSIITAGVGIQYNFVPVPVGPDPYVFVDILYNNFGKLKIDPQPTIDFSKGVSRTGLAVGLGTAVPLIPVLNLDLQVAYQMLNLVGKDSGEKTVGVVTLDLFLMFGTN